MRRLTRHEPGSIQEASQLLNTFGDSARVYAGGTEMLTLLKLGLVRCEHLINLKGIPGLDAIRYDEGTGWLHIGGLVTHRNVEHSKTVKKHLPAFAEMERGVANVRVRNVGTVAGNLCFADPYSDPGTLLSCLQAELVLQHGDSQRVVTIDSFLVDAYDTSREDDEILVEIRVPPLPPRSVATYQTFRFYERAVRQCGRYGILQRGRRTNRRASRCRWRRATHPYTVNGGPGCCWKGRGRQRG